MRRPRELPIYADRKKDRKGQWLYYFRRNGQLWRLPPLASLDFAVEYQRILVLTSKATTTEGPEDKRDYAPGTFGMLINAYFASSEFKFGKKGKKPLGARTKA